MKLADLASELWVLLLKMVELGLPGQQMGLRRTEGLVPFRLGRWKAPGGVFSWGGGRHDSYP